MIKITKEFLNSLESSIPPSAWVYEVIHKIELYTLRNATYAKNFWMAYWYSVLNDVYKKQNFFGTIDSIELDTPVFLTPDLYLFKPPVVFQKLYDISLINVYDEPLFSIPSLTLSKVAGIYIIGLVLLILFVYILISFKSDSTMALLT